MPRRVRSRARSRLVLVAVAVVALPLTPAASGPLASPAAHAAALGPASAFRPLGPTRLADTRPEEGATGFTRLAPDTIRVQVAGRAGVPLDASAAVLNVVGIGAHAPGFLTAFPAGAPRPTTASLSVSEPGSTIANLVTVKLGAGGAVDIYTNVAMEVVVDLAGSYVPVRAPVTAGRLTTLAGGARRIFDTRDRDVPTAAGFTERVPLPPDAVPPTALAAVVNIAAVEAAPGYWTAFAGGAAPLASSLNVDRPGQTRNAQAIVPLTPGAGSFSVFSQSGGHLVVDLVGYFTGPDAAASTDGLFVPADPSRLLDTRHTYAIPPWGETVIEFDAGVDPLGLGGITAAVALNVAVTEPLDVGYLTIFPAGVARPATANLNVTRLGDTVSNHAIVRLGTRGLSIFTQSGAQMIADVTGYYLGTPEQSVLPVPVDRPRGPTTAVSVSAPTAGMSVAISSGNLYSAIARGAAGLWGGSGVLGVPANNIYFAHRSSAGGPFRNLNLLRVGATFTIRGADGTVFTYQVVDTAIISPVATALVKRAEAAGRVTVTLVACHPPGSTAARIVVTGVLVGAR